jgi:hypothetical protein
MVLYGAPSSNSQDGKDLIGRAVDQAWVQVNNGKIYRLLYNENPKKGEKRLSEEYNREDLMKYLNDRMKAEDSKAILDDNNRKDFFKNNFMGIVFDEDNKDDNPFSAIFSLTDYNNNGATIQVEVPINPNPQDLIAYGISPLQAKYLNDARKSLQENYNSAVTLEYGNMKTEVYRANYDINDDIKKGMYYEIQKIEDRNVKGTGYLEGISMKKSVEKIVKVGNSGTIRDVVDYHLNKIYGGINMGALSQLQMIKTDLEKIPGEKQNDFLIKRYGFPKQSSRDENIRMLNKMIEKVTKIEPTQVEILEEEEESGK